MELSDFARHILLSEPLEEKTARVTEPFTDDSPGTAVRIEKPARPADLQFAPRRTAPKMPKPGAFQSEEKRAIAHHIMANHELQALEVMAWVLLAFPDAPTEFRLGVAEVMEDEQRHTRMHVERAAALGLQFGELPINSYIWTKAQEFQSVLEYLAGIPLTFEGRNLDHTLEFASYFERANDERSAALMRVIHRDEIEHVAFGIQWLRKLKPPGQSDWDAYRENLHWPLRPAKSKGETFIREARLQAGLSEDFIDRLEATEIDDEV